MKKLLNNRGQSLTEYMILMVLVSLAAVGVTQSLGIDSQITFQKVES
jgi:Tfp pilus assembly protein PilX